MAWILEKTYRITLCVYSPSILQVLLFVHYLALQASLYIFSSPQPFDNSLGVVLKCSLPFFLSGLFLHVFVCPLTSSIQFCCVFFKGNLSCLINKCYFSYTNFNRLRLHSNSHVKLFALNMNLIAAGSHLLPKNELIYCRCTLDLFPPPDL